jgi:hypothetical protein
MKLDTKKAHLVSFETGFICQLESESLLASYNQTGSKHAQGFSIHISGLIWERMNMLNPGPPDTMTVSKLSSCSEETFYPPSEHSLLRLLPLRVGNVLQTS